MPFRNLDHPGWGELLLLVVHLGFEGDEVNATRAFTSMAAGLLAT